MAKSIGSVGRNSIASLSFASWRYFDAIRRMPMQLRSYFATGRVSRTATTFIRVMAPTLIALSFATVAHAQGTMDFSGAQTLMGTFKTLALSIRRADEGTLSRLLVEASILLASSRSNLATILRDAASMYKVDT